MTTGTIAGSDCGSSVPGRSDALRSDAELVRLSTLGCAASGIEVHRGLDMQERGTALKTLVSTQARFRYSRGTRLVSLSPSEKGKTK